jgi:hypothetical protein
MVLATAFLLVFAIGRLLIGGSDASSDSDGAIAPAAADPTPSDPAETGDPVEKARDEPSKKKTKKGPVLAAPEGPCADADIAVTPSVKDPVAGRDVFIVLSLRTISSEACTWRVAPESLTLKITSGDDDIWSTRECPRAVRRQDVVVRQDVSTKVGVTWPGKRSGDDCTRGTQWALPGWYHVNAAALSGEPSDLQFELDRPKPEQVTETVEPKPDGDGKKDEPKRR